MELETTIVTALCDAFRETSDGDSLLDSLPLRKAIAALESYIAAVLQEAHAEWHSESIDGIMPAMATKASANELELFGDVILITDQSVVPLHLQLQMDFTTSQITWLDCRLGERGAHGLKRAKYSSGGAVVHRILLAVENSYPVEWMCHVGFGQRREVL